MECGSCKFYRGDRYGTGTCTKKEKEVKNDEYGEESCEDFEVVDVEADETKEEAEKMTQIADATSRIADAISKGITKAGLQKSEEELDEILEEYQKAEFNARVLENGRITIPSVRKRVERHKRRRLRIC